ncbi:MAG TPA: adenosylcobinamide-GDP ribazoletransferase [Tissierellales bacterium]|nr:adenosylcobinamide-GDP ribazoletransferase [Tissierellales bacterium]
MLWYTGENKMIKGLILSVQFLTRIPINIPVEFNEDNLSKSTFFFPFTGMIIGGISGLIYYLFLNINKDIASFLAVVSIIILTGGLHLDGISDTFDGFFSAREKERVLDIMKDSRAGTFGVVGVVLVILLKYITISSLNGKVPLYLALSCGNGRFMAAIIMSFGKNARSGGIGDMFSSSNPKKYALVGGTIYSIIVLLIDPLFLVSIITSLLAVLIITYKSYKIIEGFTGDVLGANIELCEIISLLTFLVMLSWI